jgi:hypothetical protein
MANANGTASAASENSTAIADLIAHINHALCKVVGTGSSIQSIASDLPETPLAQDDAFCPELVFPQLARGVIEHANTAMSLVEKLETACRKGADRWIKVTPESLPTDRSPVDAFLQETDYVERAFYDPDTGEWRGAHGGCIYKPGEVAYWRKGSRPSVEVVAEEGGA